MDSASPARAEFALRSFLGGGLVNKKTAITACLLAVGTFVLSATSACSSDSSTGSSTAFSCPKVGDKNCPNDTATTQADVDACTKCQADLQAVANCLGYAKSKCAADGTTESAPKDKCQTEQQKVLSCYTGGSATGDGGK